MKFFIAMIIAQVFCALVSLTLLGTMLYVAWHFICKLW